MIVVPKKKALLLALRNPNRVTTIIPKAQVINFKGQQLVAVPHKDDEVRVLRNLGIDAPAPMLHYYGWPGMYKPFAAQEQTAAFLSMSRRAFVLNDLGTGKSLATLWAYDYLRSIGVVSKLLVIAPLSTMERTWADEVFNHFPHLTAAVLYGSGQRRKKLLATDADVYIVNHDGAKIIMEDLKKRADIGLVVVDEIAQVARNASTTRWKVLNTIINKQTPRLAWGLTGTPIPNGPEDAWAQCRLLVPETVPKYYNRWRDMVMRQVGTYLWIPREGALDVVHNAMQPAIRFSRDECVDLPECIYQTREVPMSPEQASAYKDMMAKLRTDAAEGQVLAVNEAVKMGKLIQIACGVAYTSTGDEVSFPADNRLNEVYAITQEAAGKVIVFVPFVSTIKLVGEFLTSKGIPFAEIHGGISKAQRDQTFYDFQHDPMLRVLVAQPAAMSHGLTLTEANTIVWYAPVTSNEVFTQANGRITRPGQKRTQFIIMLEGSPVERRLFTRLHKKQKTQGLLLDLVKEER